MLQCRGQDEILSIAPQGKCEPRSSPRRQVVANYVCWSKTRRGKTRKKETFGGDWSATGIKSQAPNQGGNF
jgi:hypothetical protein